MSLDELTRGPGPWLQGNGAFSDVVVSSRVRLARNLSGFPFLSTASEEERREIYERVCEELRTSSAVPDPIFVDVDAADPLDRLLLVERHLISRNQAGGEGARGVCMARSETVAVMINEEDHLRMQVLRGGLRLDQLWEELNALDDRLSRCLPFSFDRQFGYLTACPTNVGTGIRVSVMLHLPALKWTKEIDRVERAARDMRLAVRGLFGEGTEIVGDLYQVSNQTTLGHSEEEILRSFGTAILPRIIEYEQAARKALCRSSEQQVDDRIWRAYGLLRHARCISSEEALSLLSPLRLGIHLGRFDQVSLETWNELFLNVQSAHLQKRLGRSVEGVERAIARADYIREQIAP